MLYGVDLRCPDIFVRCRVPPVVDPTGRPQDARFDLLILQVLEDAGHELIGSALSCSPALPLLF
jgi:hypothetical protein